jgi:5-methylcytosine-specific restriction endonuclease McrA
MKKSTEEKKEATAELHEWLRSLWDQMPKGIKKCKSCSGPVFGDFKPLYFDHLLEKSRYPQYRMTEENVLFVCSDCHWAKTNGFPTKKHLEFIKNALKLHLEDRLQEK